MFRAVSSGSHQQEDDEEFIITPDSTATLEMPRVFGNNMVVQRDADIKVWGTSNKNGAKIRGTFMGEEARGTVKGGKWEITFSAKEATTENQVLTVEDSCGNKLEISNVLVGDVWIVSGQSNAKRTISESRISITVDKNIPLRVFQQDETDVTGSNESKTASLEPCDDILNINTKRGWKAGSKISAQSFSAIGWFAGTELAKKTGVPQGFICTAAGAANIAELMPKETADKYNYTKGIFASPGSYYNALTHPFLKMKIKGMIFFQGEAEGGTNSVPSSKDYARDFEALMTELRSRWGVDFPVYNVQLSNYVGDEADINWTHVGEVRAQQYEAYKTMSGVKLIPSYDLGSKTTDPDGVHSPYKEALANRISALILADLYGVGSADKALAPEPAQITKVSSNDGEKTIEIKFINVGEGLISTGGSDSVSGFYCGTNEHPYDYYLTAVTAKIVSKDTVRLTVPASCGYIGYACTKRVDTNDVLNTQLYSSNELPALAFYLELE